MPTTSTTDPTLSGAARDSATPIGLPVEAFEFYEALTLDNSRAWWQEHRSEYETHVRAPMAALLTALEAEFGAGHLFRPYRDTRFAKDKTPIKDHQGAIVEVEDAVGYYVQVSASGLLVAGGWYAPRGMQLVSFRSAIEDGHAGHIRGLLGTLAKQGWRIEGRPLKTRPRGVDPDHPDLDLLRFRALTASKSFPVEPWMGTRKALTTVRSAWRQVGPLTEWLGDHVGPAEDPAVPPE